MIGTARTSTRPRVVWKKENLSPQFAETIILADISNTTPPSESLDLGLNLPFGVGVRRCRYRQTNSKDSGNHNKFHEGNRYGLHIVTPLAFQALLCYANIKKKKTSPVPPFLGLIFMFSLGFFFSFATIPNDIKQWLSARKSRWCRPWGGD